MQKAKNRSTRPSRLRAVQDSRGDLPPEDGPEDGHRAPDALPDGYGDGLLWAMAEEFERKAWAEKASLRGRGVPYVYRALERSVARAGLRGLAVKDAAGNPVSGTGLGIALVRFFWDEAPWDPDGDLIAQFTDPVMFCDCLGALRKGWSEQRSHRAIQRRITSPGYVPESFARVRRPGARGGAWR